MDKYNKGFGRSDYDQEDRRENDAVRREDQQRKQTEQGQPGRKTTKEEERPMKNEPIGEDFDKSEKKGSWW